MGLVADILGYALQVFVFLLWARLVLDLVQVVTPNWRPRGIVLVGAEVAYTVTDPPIRFFRRFVPPLRLGPVSLDLAWTITLVVCLVLEGLLRRL